MCQCECELVIIRVCLIGINSEKGRLGRLRICVLFDSQIPKTACLAGLEGLLNLLFQWQKVRRFDRLWRYSRFHLQISENEAN